MDLEDGIYDFMPATEPASKKESVLDKLGEEYRPVSKAADERLGNAAKEAMKIIASGN